MKTNVAKSLLAVSIVSVAVGLSGQPSTSSGDRPTNRASLASPRTLEEFPELLRAASSTSERATQSRSERLADLTANRALAASPRFREEHLELLVPSEQENGGRRIAPVDNRAVASSPRYLEEHPELLHPTPAFEIAPAK